MWGVDSGNDRAGDIASSVEGWFWEVDYRGHFTYASDQVKRLLGYSVSEILDLTLFDLVSLDDVGQRVNPIGEAFLRRQPMRDLCNALSWRRSCTILARSLCPPKYW